MRIINKNTYKIMYGLDFIEPNEVKELDDKLAKILLKHPNVEEFIAVAEAKKLEDENAELKKQLELERAKNKADKLGITYSKNIGLEKLLKRIEDFEKSKEK